MLSTKKEMFLKRSWFQCFTFLLLEYFNIFQWCNWVQCSPMHFLSFWRIVVARVLNFWTLAPRTSSGSAVQRSWFPGIPKIRCLPFEIATTKLCRLCIRQMSLGGSTLTFLSETTSSFCFTPGVFSLVSLHRSRGLPPKPGRQEPPGGAEGRGAPWQREEGDGENENY